MRGQPTTLHCGISLVNRGSETPIEFPITGLLGRNNFRLALPAQPVGATPF